MLRYIQMPDGKVCPAIIANEKTGIDFEFISFIKEDILELLRDCSLSEEVNVKEHLSSFMYLLKWMEIDNYNEEDQRAKKEAWGFVEIDAPAGERGAYLKAQAEKAIKELNDCTRKERYRKFCESVEDRREAITHAQP